METDRPLLLIVDVQNGFINEFTNRIPSAVEWLQEQYELVVAAKFYNPPGSFFRTLLDWHALSKDTQDFGLAFNLRDNAAVVEKTVYSCVDASFIEMLHSKSVTRVDLCGIDTDVCVTKSAVDLFEAGIEPVVLKDYCASTAGPQAQKSALTTLKRYIGEGQIR